MLSETYELASACLQTNYYGAKLTTEALLPVLHLSSSPTIVNVSSASGKLKVTNSFHFATSIKNLLEIDIKPNQSL